MITPKAYATADEYLSAIGRNNTQDISQVEDVLEAISRGLDNELGRFFGQTEAPQSRVYMPGDDAILTWGNDPQISPWGGTILTVDDIATTEDLVIKLDEDDDGLFEAEQALESSDYELLPRRAQQGPEPRPYNRIRMTEYGNTGSFAAGQRVHITARFGWPEVPRVIKHSTIQLAAIWRLESPRATTRVPELTEVTQASPEARMIVLRLREKYARRTYA